MARLSREYGESVGGAVGEHIIPKQDETTLGYLWPSEGRAGACKKCAVIRNDDELCGFHATDRGSVWKVAEKAVEGRG